MTQISDDVSYAARVLHEGGVIAYATEAVFGLGCDPANSASIEKLLDLKQRPASKGLILIAANEDQLHYFLDLGAITTAIWQQVHTTWPGPVTWLLPAARSISTLLRGEHDTIAVRVTAHTQVCALCDAFGGALISTSANRSNQSPARDVEQVRSAFGDELDFILAGQTGGADRPSEIRDGFTGKIIRAG